jgi:8-oxo-dGTP diphosphatase
MMGWFCYRCGARLPGRPPVGCPGCATPQYLNAKASGSALVTNGAGELLLVRRGRRPELGLWDIPGGFCEPDEHPTRTARREVLEETGIATRIVGFLGIWLGTYESEPGVLWPTLNVYYIAEAAEDRLPGSNDRSSPEETLDCRWFAPQGLPLRDIAFPQPQASVLLAWRTAVRERAVWQPLWDSDDAGPHSGEGSLSGESG